MFGNMFGFLDMMSNYEDRKVARNDFDWGFVSTASVTDGAHQFETAVKHDRYNSGKIVIVEHYDSKEDAEAGHKKWVETMTAPKLPTALTDCCNAGIGQLAEAVGCETVFERDSP